MKKRVLAALLVTMMTVGTVAGCGSNDTAADTTTETAMPNLMIQIKKQVQSLRVMTKKIPERK